LLYGDEESVRVLLGCDAVMYPATSLKGVTTQKNTIRGSYSLLRTLGP